MEENTENTAYKVLARKYRPQTFADLIGQEALVRTLSNAIKVNRIAQSYMLTGIRGVGKTTSARIIAKALNCVGEDGKGSMTPFPCGKCEHCLAISEDRHIDVQEIDAASNTQVDNVREIIQSAKYAPVSARFKVYIIDEVHMLSKSAANALLKLLEEPPERVKFIFATTEIRKVPVTILSRCQRFDLRRVEPAEIAAYFKTIVEKENVSVTDEALDIIAKCADGSVRDGLSLLDQVIAHSAGNADAEMVRAMLGLSDKTALFSLFEAMADGDIKTALSIVDEQKKNGADALMLLQDLSDLTFSLTKIKVSDCILDDITLSQELKTKGAKLAAKIPMAILTRVWQMLMKGIEEVKTAGNSFSALEMVLIRLAYSVNMPTLAELTDGLKKKYSVEHINPAEKAENRKETTPEIPSATEKTTRTQLPKEIKETAETTETSNLATTTVAEQKPAPSIKSLKDIAQMARGKNKLRLAINIEKYLHPVAVENKIVKVRAESDAPADLVQQMYDIIREYGFTDWQIHFVEDEGYATIDQQKNQYQNKLKLAAAEEDLIQEVKKIFPTAEITEAMPKTPSKLDFDSDFINYDSDYQFDESENEKW